MMPTQVLNIEPDGAMRYARTRLLRKAGFSVTEGGTGAEALSRLASDPHQVVLLSVDLPDTSGFEVCRRLKGNPDTSQTSVICIADHYERGQMDQSRQVRADAYLAEPLEVPALISCIRELVEKSAKLQQQATHLKERLADGMDVLGRSGEQVRLSAESLSALVGSPRPCRSRQRCIQTVIVAEDEPLVLAVAAAVLARAGYRVLQAETTGKVRTLLQENGPVDLLLVDVGMEGRAELLEDCLRDWPVTRVIHTSGYSSEEVERRGVQIGFSYLAKPFTAGVLLAKIREVLEGPPPDPESRDRDPYSGK